MGIHFNTKAIVFKINPYKVELKFEDIINERCLCYVTKNNNYINNIINLINNKKEESDYY